MVGSPTGICWALRYGVVLVPYWQGFLFLRRREGILLSQPTCGTVQTSKAQVTSPHVAGHEQSREEKIGGKRYAKSPTEYIQSHGYRATQYRQTAVIGEHSLQWNGMPTWPSCVILLYEMRWDETRQVTRHRTQATKGISKAWPNATVAISFPLALTRMTNKRAGRSLTSRLHMRLCEGLYVYLIQAVSIRVLTWFP
jgi:hypothetical protein